MALDYYLQVQNIDNRLNPQELLKSLASIFSFQVIKNSNTVIGLGFNIDVFYEDDEFDESMFNSFYPDICFAYHIDKFDQYEDGIGNMLKTVNWLLSYFDEDMILLFNGEQVILKRISNKLILNDDAEFWESQRLSFLSLSYKLSKINSF